MSLVVLIPAYLLQAYGTVGLSSPPVKTEP
jgi:hypothetical protein